MVNPPSKWFKYKKNMDKNNNVGNNGAEIEIKKLKVVEEKEKSENIK